MLKYTIYKVAIVLGEIGFNDSEATDFVNSFMQPLTKWLLWLIPVAAIISALVAGITWYTRDEEERERKPYIKTLKPILYVTLICECITIIFKIFGL